MVIRVNIILKIVSQHLLYSTFVVLAKNSLPPIQSSKHERKLINNTLFASQYPATPQLEQKIA